MSICGDKSVVCEETTAFCTVKVGIMAGAVVIPFIGGFVNSFSTDPEFRTRNAIAIFSTSVVLNVINVALDIWVLQRICKRRTYEPIEEPIELSTLPSKERPKPESACCTPSFAACSIITSICAVALSMGFGYYAINGYTSDSS